jgi:hypothetical protein
LINWDDYKNIENNAEYKDALREFKRKEYNVEDELKVLQYEPEYLLQNIIGLLMLVNLPC